MADLLRSKGVQRIFSQLRSMAGLKVTFVGIGTEQLGVSQLSAIAKQRGHTVGLAFSASLFHDRFNLEIPSIAPLFNDTDEALRSIALQQPDVLALSPITATFQWMLGIAEKAKQMNPDLKVIFGGVHASAVPALVLDKPQVDYVVVGEGDVAFPAILDAIQKNDLTTPIPNTRFVGRDGKVVVGLQKGFIQDLDSLPFYDKVLWENDVIIGDMYLTMASRGCPYRCTFCFNNFFAKLPEEKSGKYVRLRSPEHMMAELRFAKKRYNLRYVDFNDDVFTTNKKWIHDFLDLYKKEIKVPFAALTHPRYIDEDIARWLKEAGGEWIQMGVQSMDEGFKKDNLMRYEKSDHIHSALELMHKHGIHAKVDHMLGLPNEPIAAQETARQLYATHHPKRIQTFWTCYLPGTDMMKEAVETGVLSPEQERKINEGEDFFFFRNTDNIKDQSLVNLYKAYELIYRIMPILPHAWKIKLKPEHLTWIPYILVRPISSAADIFNAVLHGLPEFWPYARHHSFHFRRFVARKLGYRGMKASKVIDPNAVPEFSRPAEIPTGVGQVKDAVAA
jgi:anaerobic magnesium-protoporphyrin IX monomethyl ester cyclase